MRADRILARVTQLPGVRSLWTRFPVGSVATRVRYGIWARPHYAYGVYQAANLAHSLGIGAISALEFGVAGGQGLLELETIAIQVERSLGVRIAVFGFDSGTGMPQPTGYRDLPHVWGEGFYRMDEAKLKAELKRARLVLGDVGKTVTAFAQDQDPPAVGFVSFDLDYYSSTKKALAVFDSAPARRLPRVYCYFDDTIWPEEACYNEWTGELCAIREFNLEHEQMKLCPIHMLRHIRVHAAAWNDQMYVLHDFAHPFYSTSIVPHDEQHTQIRLR